MTRGVLIDWDGNIFLDAEEKVHIPNWKYQFPPDGLDFIQRNLPEELRVQFAPEDIPRIGLTPYRNIQLALPIFKAMGYKHHLREEDYITLKQFGVIEGPYNPDQELTAEQFELIRRQRMLDIVSDPNVKIKPAPGILELLKKLGQQNIPVGIVTSNTMEYVAAVLKRWKGEYPDLAPKVDFIHSAGLVDKPKPHQDPYDLGYNLMAKLVKDRNPQEPDLQPSEVAFSGDSKTDMVGARAAGMKPIGFADHTSEQALRDNGAVFVIKSSFDEIDPTPGGTFDQEPFMTKPDKESKLEMYTFVREEAKTDAPSKRTIEG